MSGRIFLEVRVTVQRRGDCFRVIITETRGYDEKIYGRCEVVGNSTRLDAALADAVTRARKSEIEIRCLTRAVAKARNAAVDVLLQEEKNGDAGRLLC
jgi:hypothetical protein